MVLDGYGLDTATPRIGRRMELRLRWRPLQPLPKGLGVVVELRPVSGGRPTVLTLPLEPNGDFRIDDTLNPPPSECASPVLLIRTSSNGTWFAAGIPKLVDDDQ